MVSRFFSVAATVVVFGALTSCSDSGETPVSDAGVNDSVTNTDTQVNDANGSDGTVQVDAVDNDVNQQDTTPEQDVLQSDTSKPDVDESDVTKPDVDESDVTKPDAPLDTQPDDTAQDVPMDTEVPDGIVSKACMDCAMSECKESYDKCVANAQCNGVMECVLVTEQCLSKPDVMSCALKCATDNGVTPGSPAYDIAMKAYICISSNCKDKCGM